MVNNDKVSASNDKAFLKNMGFDVKKIIDVQAETIKYNENIVELQLESIEERLDHISIMKEEIEYLQSLMN